MTTLEQILVSSCEAVRPPERLTVSQAASRIRWLNNAGSYVGPWLNEKTPYLVEPMDTLDSLDFTGMIFVGPARTGKTDMSINWAVKTAIYDPADMMFFNMTQAAARDWSQGDLAKAFRHTKEFGATLVPGKHNDNVHDKKFLSGMRLLIKWPTITEMSGKTIPRLWLADYDRMDQNVDGEGNPFDLARKRAETFKRRGMCVAESSPGFEVEDPKWVSSSPNEAPPTKGILALYNRGDRRRWHWRCPQCEETFEPHFSRLSYPISADFMESAEQAVLVCPHDGFPMTPDMKFELNLGGRWVKEGMVWLPDGSMTGAPRRSDIASFWMMGPAAAFSDWKKLVFNYLSAQAEFENTGSEEALKSTTNLDQGLPYIPKALLSDRAPDALASRVEDWGGSKDEPVVPFEVRFLIATVDVQARAFVVQVQGFGQGGDCWLVDMFKIRKSFRQDARGDLEILDPAAYPEDWLMLVDEVMRRTYPLADGSGRRMRIKMTACDSGGREGVTTNAYNFWRYLKRGKALEGATGANEGFEWEPGLDKVFHLVKGDVSKNMPRVSVRYPDSNRRDRNAGARGDVPVLFLHTNLMKDQVAAKLGRTDAGGGMIHLPIWSEQWLFTQLTSEIRTPKGWENPRQKRNEAWDLLVYAEAVALNLKPALEKIDWTKPPTWAEEWDENDLVFDPIVNSNVDTHVKRVYDLKALGEKLS